MWIKFENESVNLKDVSYMDVVYASNVENVNIHFVRNKNDLDGDDNIIFTFDNMEMAEYIFERIHQRYEEGCKYFDVMKEVDYWNSNLKRC